MGPHRQVLGPRWQHRRYHSDVGGTILNIENPAEFERLVSEAAAQPFSGWDFSWIADRWRAGRTSWDYGKRVREAISEADSLLDMGTGGGENLASMAPLSADAYATEAYLPNVPVARATLEPLGVRVVAVDDPHALPFGDGRFDLVINRHEEFIASEVARILKPGGLFITQQVGEKNDRELNEWLGGKAEEFDFTLEWARSELTQAGLEVVAHREAFSETALYDIGAIVYYLRAVPWQVVGFTVEGYRDQLAAIHNHIQRHGSFVVTSQRCYLEARKP